MGLSSARQFAISDDGQARRHEASERQSSSIQALGEAVEIIGHAIEFLTARRALMSRLGGVRAALHLMRALFEWLVTQAALKHLRTSLLYFAEQRAH